MRTPDRQVESILAAWLNELDGDWFEMQRRGAFLVELWFTLFGESRKRAKAMRKAEGRA